MKNKSWVKNSLTFELNSLDRKLDSAYRRSKNLPHMQEEFDYLIFMYSEMLDVVNERVMELEIE